jgi:hypothetical protein
MIRRGAAPRELMLMSFQHRRKGIVGDCRAMKLEDGSYNEAHPHAEPIQFAHFPANLYAESAEVQVSPKCRPQLQRQQLVYARQDTMARSSSGPKSPENIATRVPAPRTTAINLSAIIFESPIDSWQEVRTVLFPECFVVSGN